MKKTRSISLIVVLAMLAAVLFTFTSCANNESGIINLKLAHFFPATHTAEVDWVQGWIKEVEKVTDGKVIIESYPAGTLLAAANIYSGVVSGEADIGLSCFVYTPGRFPVLEAFELPGITYRNSRSASMVAWEAIKILDPAEIQDTKLLTVIATGPGDLFTKTPVYTLADLKGMSIRATGISAETIKILGGTPIGMSQNDAYDALQKGTVKGNIAPLETLQGWKHAEVTKYITRISFLNGYNTLFFITMNKEKWESIPENLREKIIEVTEKFHDETAIGLWDKQNEAALKFAVEEHGMIEIELSDEEKTLWMEAVMPIQDTYRQKLANLGIDADPLTLINELAEKYNKIYE